MSDYKQYKQFTDNAFMQYVGQEIDSGKKRIKQFYPTTFYGIVEVIDPSNRDALIVRFLEDGTTRKVSLHNLVKGKCKNPSVKKRTSVELSTHFDDIVYSNKVGCEFKITSRTGKFCQVEFIETGLVVQARISNASKGKVIDHLHPSVYGVGFLGTNDNLSVKYKKEYTLWHNMLKRAYCKEDKRGYYGRVFVDPSWFNFTTFLRDLPSLKDYDLWVAGQNGTAVDKYNLDKDFSYLGCNTYSKENCQFVIESLNKGTTSKTLDARARIAKYKKEKSMNE